MYSPPLQRSACRKMILLSQLRAVRTQSQEGSSEPKRSGPQKEQRLLQKMEWKSHPPEPRQASPAEPQREPPPVSSPRAWA